MLQACSQALSSCVVCSCREVDAQAISLQQPAPDAQPLSFDTEFALGLWDQFKVLLRYVAKQACLEGTIEDAWE